MSAMNVTRDKRPKIDFVTDVVEQLIYETSREAYPHSGRFAAYLLETGWYDALPEAAVLRLNEYVGESEHGGYDIPEVEWEHLIHLEARWAGLDMQCLPCLVKGEDEDYRDFWMYR